MGMFSMGETREIREVATTLSPTPAQLQAAKAVPTEAVLSALDIDVKATADDILRRAEESGSRLQALLAACK